MKKLFSKFTFRRADRRKDDVDLGEGTDVLPGPATSLSVGNSSLSETAPVVVKESLFVEGALPQSPSEPVRSKPGRSKGRRGKRAKEGAAGNSRKGYCHICVSLEVFSLFMKCKRLWQLSEGTLINFSHGDFMQVLLDEFSKNNFDKYFNNGTQKH